jgi:hypothetical protein
VKAPARTRKTSRTAPVDSSTVAASSARKLQQVAPVRLVFRDEGETAPGGEAISTDLSAAALSGQHLWVASDETARVERLTRLADDRWGNHRVFAIGALVDLPDQGEMDIEGLAVDGGYLWAVGSHSARRLKPGPGERDPDKVRERLATLKWDPNRWFLGRLALADEADGQTLVRKVKGTTATRRSASLPIRKRKGTELYQILGGDPQLGPFMGLPAKENGFDIEGLAVRGERVLLGLRGPVLRGWSTVLELRLREVAKGQLALVPLGEDGAERYRKHLLDLDGLGIRELCWHEEDLLILAGPTMDLDGPVRLHRWRRPLAADTAAVLHRGDLELVSDLPFGQGVDHAEGLVVIDEGRDHERLLVIYDSPAPSRLEDQDRVHLADAFVLHERKVTSALDHRSIGPDDLVPEGPVRTAGRTA